MEGVNSSLKKEWSVFYQNWKKVWRDPEISTCEKAVLFNVHLYSSDARGWSISERKMARDLGISKETASKNIDKLIKKELIFGSRRERKRGKLRLSGFLRSPVRTKSSPNNWTTEKSSKYQIKYQNNKDNSLKKENN